MKQKRWTSEEEILAAIDKAKANEQACLERCQEWNALKTEYFRMACNPDIRDHKAAHLREEAYTFKARADKAERGAKNAAGHARILGEKLAAFRTGVFTEICANDLAVV